MNWHFDKPNKESEEVVCCFAYITEKDCIERGDFVFINLSNKMIFMSNSGEYYNSEIRDKYCNDFSSMYNYIKLNGYNPVTFKRTPLI